MNAAGHEAFAGMCWVGGCVAVNAVAWAQGVPGVVHPAVIVLGLPVARATSAGRNSPDVDRVWAPGWPDPGYGWRGHRGWTHRYWFALAVVWPVSVALMVWMGVSGVPWPVAVVAFAPAVGWTSHLLSDQVWGRLRVAGRARGLGWHDEPRKRRDGSVEPARGVSQRRAAWWFRVVWVGAGLGQVALLTVG